MRVSSVILRCGAVATAGLVPVVLAVSPAAAVVTASSSGTSISILSDAEGNSITFWCTAPGGNVTVNTVQVAPALACSALTAVGITAGGGADIINLGTIGTTGANGFPALTTVSIGAIDFGSPAADMVTGSLVRDVVLADGLDTVNGLAGDDQIEGAKFVDGGAGDDLLIGAWQNVNGGDGDDRIIDPVSGPIDGGAGDDSLEMDFSDLSGGDPVVISLSNTTVSADLGSGVGLTGVSGIERFEVDLPSSSTAPQSVDTRGFSGRAHLRGYAGPDTLRSGGQPDILEGGPGADVLDPGAGSDTVYAGRDNDSVNARDGAADIVDCGAGTDAVDADRADVLIGCEDVDVPPPATGKVNGPAKVTKGQKATFTFDSSIVSARFECRIDSGKWKPCKSPYKVATSGLSVGKHTLSVRAVEPVGNPDASPAKKSFKVVAKRR